MCKIEVMDTNTNMSMSMNTNNSAQIFSILQLAGGNFPVGGFTQSWGLETYVDKGIIKNVADFEEFLKMFLNNVICCSEAPLVIFAYENTRSWNPDKLAELNQLSIAMKLTKENRESSVKTGKAMLRIGKEMLKDRDIEIFYEEHKEFGINFSVAFGMIAAKMAIDIEKTVTAYIFSSINALIQSGIKLIPLGNIEAQELFLEMNQSLSDAVDKSFTIDIEEISNFTPGLDLASIEHENLKTRLYMS